MASSCSLLPAAARRMEGKVALVTGGAAGIGESTVRLLCRHGARVVVADIQDKKGEALCGELGGPAVATYVHCDVTDESHVRGAVDTAVATYGKLDVAFSNAGIVESFNPHLVEATKEDFEKVVAVNLTGTFLVTKHAARVMIPARRGNIVINASVASVVGGDGSYAYTSSKHAVVGLCKEAASELGRHGVRVNCVSPYFVATAMAVEGFGPGFDHETVEAMAESWGILKGVRLKAEDIAEAVLYLAGDEAKYVNGHNLIVDGGQILVTCILPLPRRLAAALSSSKSSAAGAPPLKSPASASSPTGCLLDVVAASGAPPRGAPPRRRGGKRSSASPAASGLLPGPPRR